MYVSAEKVKQARKAIRKEFPVSDGWKVSVTRENQSGIRIKILQAPSHIDFESERNCADEINTTDLGRELWFRGMNDEAANVIYAMHYHAYSDLGLYYTWITLGWEENPVQYV